MPLEAVRPPAILWRISNHRDLDGGGGLRAAGRWHSRGRRVVYCATSPAAALLETLVHLEIDREDIPLRYRLMKIGVPEATSCLRLDPATLARRWIAAPEMSRQIGDDWLASAASALLEVPSALAPETWNVLLNPQHPDAGLVGITAVVDSLLDRRLQPMADQSAGRR